MTVTAMAISIIAMTVTMTTASTGGTADGVIKAAMTGADTATGIAIITGQDAITAPMATVDIAGSASALALDSLITDRATG